jgi:hypothetical protein
MKMKLKTTELQGEALDRAVAHCVEWSKKFPIFTDGEPMSKGNYSTDWALGGPIIEREGITLGRNEQKSFVGQQPWVSYFIEHLFMDEYEHEYQYGPTPLIAAMRCYVASKLGDEVEVPDELLQS